MQRKWYREPHVWLRTGCGCFVLVIILLPFWPAAVFWGILTYEGTPRHGEHLPKAKKYSPHATNDSYYSNLFDETHEFDIPENAFWEMSQTKQWQPLSIEALPELSKNETQDEYPLMIKDKRDIPVKILRYVYWYKPEHEECRTIAHGHCKVDPSGKTDASCFRSVSQGYYYEIRGKSGAGTLFLYDSENGRCYIHTCSF